MRLIRFNPTGSGKICYGELTDDGHTVVATENPFTGEKSDNASYRLEEITLLAPVEPPNVIAIGLNYRQHAAESGADLPDEPVIFLKATTAVTGPGSPIVLPRVAPNEVDYEAELGLVIGHTAKDVSAEHALHYVLGYTCGNDVSARDCQLRYDRQWARAKSFDTFCPLGPSIQTELDPDNADIRTLVNGQVAQASNTSDQIFSCARLVAFLSSCVTLLPGTVVLTGTPPGVGFARKPPVFLNAGDTVQVEIAGVGTLSNPVQHG